MCIYSGVCLYSGRVAIRNTEVAQINVSNGLYFRLKHRSWLNGKLVIIQFTSNTAIIILNRMSMHDQE